MTSAPKTSARCRLPGITACRIISTWAKVEGEPHPLDGEAKSCIFIDVRDVKWTATELRARYGAQHDLILMVYRLYLAGRPVDLTDFADFRALRANLRELLANVKD